MEICIYEVSCLLDLLIVPWIFEVSSDNTSVFQGRKWEAGRCMLCDTTINLEHASNVAKEVLNKLGRYLYMQFEPKSEKMERFFDSYYPTCLEFTIEVTLIVLNSFDVRNAFYVYFRAQSELQSQKDPKQLVHGALQIITQCRDIFHVSSKEVAKVCPSLTCDFT